MCEDSNTTCNEDFYTTQGINSGGFPNDNMMLVLLNSMQSIMFLCIMFGLQIQLKPNMFFTCKKKSRERYNSIVLWPSFK